jgi:hypothetical protein
VNADTAAFQAVAGQLAELAAKVESLETRVGSDTDALVTALGIAFGAGKDAARRELGLPSVHAAGTPGPRHLHTIRGDR